MNQGINQSMNQSFNESISELINESIIQRMNQSFNQPNNESIDQSINQSINQLMWFQFCVALKKDRANEKISINKHKTFTHNLSSFDSSVLLTDIPRDCR